MREFFTICWTRALRLIRATPLPGPGRVAVFWDGKRVRESNLADYINAATDWRWDDVRGTWRVAPKGSWA